MTTMHPAAPDARGQRRRRRITQLGWLPSSGLVALLLVLAVSIVAGRWCKMAGPVVFGRPSGYRGGPLKPRLRCRVQGQ